MYESDLVEILNLDWDKIVEALRGFNTVTFSTAKTVNAFWPAWGLLCDYDKPPCPFDKENI